MKKSANGAQVRCWIIWKRFSGRDLQVCRDFCLARLRQVFLDLWRPEPGFLYLFCYLLLYTAG